MNPWSWNPKGRFNVLRIGKDEAGVRGNETEVLDTGLPVFSGSKGVAPGVDVVTNPIKSESQGSASEAILIILTARFYSGLVHNFLVKGVGIENGRL